MKSIAIMQPYLFPYIGYFQLAYSVDEFWIYDNVQYIRRGWINRNYILANGEKELFSIPVVRGHQLDQIADKRLAENANHQVLNMLKQIKQAYAKSEFSEKLIQLVVGLSDLVESGTDDLTTVLEYTLKETFSILDISTPIFRVSSLNLQNTLSGQDKIIGICQTVSANCYINSIGGQELYDQQIFNSNNIRLNFIQPQCLPYHQANTNNFIPCLSILDVIANVNPQDIRKLLEAYTLLF